MQHTNEYVSGDFLAPRYRIVAARRRPRVDPVQRGTWLLCGLCVVGLIVVTWIG